MANPPQHHIIMSTHDEHDWTGEWFREIGWIGYYFGQMEWTPYLLADRVGASQGQQKKMRGMTFAQRCVSARTSLVPQVGDPALRMQWDAILVEVGECGKMRNKILHNPFELNLNEIQSHGINVHQGIRLLKNGCRILSLGDVQEYSTGLVDLHTRILDLLARTPEVP